MDERLRVFLGRRRIHQDRSAIGLDHAEITAE